MDRRLVPPPMRTAVPRFSALALASIGLVIATGAYSAWVETGTILPIGTEYGRTLILKSALVLGALAVGGLNYFDGGRMKDWLDGFPTRIKVEVLLGAAILVMSAVLATTPPVDEASGVAIQPVPDAFGEVAPGMKWRSSGPAGSQPGRRQHARGDGRVDRMELALDDLDKGTSTSVPLVLEGMEGMADMPGMDHSAWPLPTRTARSTGPPARSCCPRTATGTPASAS